MSGVDLVCLWSAGLGGDKGGRSVSVQRPKPKVQSDSYVE